jgi:predicted DNA-binding transcriptional regulator
MYIIIYNVKSQILIKCLTILGLSEFQILLWLEIYSDYNLTISELARRLNVQRLKIYDNLEILQKLGLAKISKEGQNKIVNTTKLDNLLEQLEIHQFTTKQSIEELQFYTSKNQNNSDYKITQYKGLEEFVYGFFKILELCKPNSEIFHFGDNDSIFDVLGQRKSKEWIKIRLSKKIYTNEILPNNYTSKYLHENDNSELRNVKIIKYASNINTSYLLFNKSLAIWNINKLKLEIFDNLDMYETFKINFDLAWNSID